MKLKLLIVFFLITALSLAEDNTFSITGTIHYKEAGKIYLYLFDKETFKVPFTGNIKVIIKTKNKSGIVDFELRDIPKGTYGIRAFQDTNNNGKLDRGLFGPKEPWWVSWEEGEKKKWPKFDKVSFEVNKNVKNYKIVMEESD